MSRILCFFPFFFMLCVANADTNSEPLVTKTFNRGLKLLKNHRNDEAILLFEKVKGRFPQEPEAIEADYYIAQAHFNAQSFGQAALSFDLFSKLNASHPKYEDSLYYHGLSYFKMLPKTADRDLSDSQSALRAWQNLLNEKPQSKYKADVQKNVNHIQNLLAEHEYLIGHHYFKTKDYSSALGRFNFLMTRFPKSTYIISALPVAIESAKELNIPTQNYEKLLRTLKPQTP